MLLSSFCASYPFSFFSKERGMKDKLSYSIELVTRSYPVLSFVYDLFYIDGVKCIQEELFHYLSPQAIAY